MFSNRGFTLIELMIAVAIIAVLSAIAVPTFQIYVGKSQIAGALAEISAGKSSFESELLAANVSSTSPEYIGLKSTTTLCDTAIDSAPDGFIRCRMKGGPTVSGKTLTLRRTVDGAWHCQVDATIPQRYWPNPCI